MKTNRDRSKDVDDPLSIGNLWRMSIDGCERQYRNVLMGTLLIFVVGIALAAVVRPIYNNVIPSGVDDAGALASLKMLAAGALVAMVMEWCLKQSQAVLIHRANQVGERRGSRLLIERTLGRAAIDIGLSGSQGAQVFAQFEPVRAMFSVSTATTLLGLPLALGCVAYEVAIGGVLALPTIVGAVLALMWQWALQGRTTKASLESSVAKLQRQALGTRTLQSLDNIRLNRRDASTLADWDRMTDAVMVSDGAVQELAAQSNNAVSFCSRGASLGITIFGAWAVMAGETSMGLLIALGLLNGLAIGPLTQLSGLAMRYAQYRAATKQLRPLFDSVQLPADQPSLAPEHLESIIVARGVTVTREGHKVLDSVDFIVRPGEVLGVMGAEGCGKSTLLQVLCGLMPVAGDSGSVEVGHMSINSLDRQTLYRKITVMQQDCERAIIEGTLLDNLVYGLSGDEAKTPAVAERINKVCIDIGLKDLVVGGERGLNVKIREGGSNLSAGQRRKVALGRALVSNGDILLLDEPTDGVSVATEQQIGQCIKGLAIQGKTVVVISHSANLLRDVAGRVMVLDKGKVASANLNLSASPQSGQTPAPQQHRPVVGARTVISAVPQQIKGHVEQVAAMPAATPHISNTNISNYVAATSGAATITTSSEGVAA